MNDRTLLFIAGGFILLAIAGGGALMSSVLNASQIQFFAARAGFSGLDLSKAVAIALAESSGNPTAVGDVGIGEGSFGLWQINSHYHPEYGPDFTSLYDPQTNANAAFSIYKQSGNSFNAWSTYNSGAYLTYLNT